MKKSLVLSIALLTAFGTQAMTSKPNLNISKLELKKKSVLKKIKELNKQRDALGKITEATDKYKMQLEYQRGLSNIALEDSRQILNELQK